MGSRATSAAQGPSGSLLVLLAALLLLRLSAASCPNQCYRQGACTRGACSCYRGFAGVDCVHKLEHEGSGMPAYSELDIGGQGTEEQQQQQDALHSQMRIAVASAQVLGATYYDDLDVVIPGLTVARQLVSQRHHVTLIFCLHEQKDLELRYVWQKALMEEGIQLEVIYHTQHYYLPANLAHSFETYAWISDWVNSTGRPFDVVYFHDGHGLPYFSALAKHQDLPNCGLRDSLLVMGTQLPLLWLTVKGGGGGLKNVDELEINFIEHESARLVDHVVTPSRHLDKWMSDRNWRLPWTTYAMPQPLPQKDLERLQQSIAPAAKGISSSSSSRGRRQFVFVIEGPGSGVLGKSVSSGKNQNSAMSREVTKADEEDRDRYEHVSDDTIVACEVATKLAGMLEEGELSAAAFTFFLLGADEGTHPHAAQQIKYFARSRKWNFTWAVARGSSSQAVEHAAAPGATVLLQAVRFRGSATTVLLRRVLVAQQLQRSVGRQQQQKQKPRAVISAVGDAAELLTGFVAAEDSDSNSTAASLFSGADSDAIMHRMLEAYRGTGPLLGPALDELEVASASATWLNYLPWHTSHIRQEVFSYDGTAGRLFMEVQQPETSSEQQQQPARAAADGVVITKEGPKVVLKGDPLVGQAAQGSSNGGVDEAEQVGWRREAASRQASKVARWSAQQLGVALEELNGTAAGATFRPPRLRYGQPYPPYRQPLVTVVITHYNRPKLLPLAVRSVAEQTYPNIQLVVVDDGSPNADVPEALDELEAKHGFRQRGWAMLREPNRYLGGARNRGVREAAGEYILFMDDDNVAKPFEVEYFVQAMESTGADILTSFVDFVWGENYPQLPSVRVNMASQNPLPEGFDKNYRRSPSFVFLGGSADVGIFKNCFGDANSFFRKSTFLEMGGYSEDRGIGYEDWELYSRAALKGYNLMVMAQSLYWYRFTGGSMQKTTSYSRSRQRALRAYIEVLHENRDAGLEGLQEVDPEECGGGHGSRQCGA